MCCYNGTSINGHSLQWKTSIIIMNTTYDSVHCAVHHMYTEYTAVLQWNLLLESALSVLNKEVFLERYITKSCLAEINGFLLISRGTQQKH